MISMGIIGKKLGMTQVFDGKGHLAPVTVVKAGPCPIVQIKTQNIDGYSALQLGFDRVGRKLAANKPFIGRFQKNDLEPVKILKEFKIKDSQEYKVGDKITVEEFKVSEKINVVGYSKGRGFSGVMKRHGFAGKDSGHGAHEAYRHGGSIGCRTPKHTIKGMKMPGRLGNTRFTVKNLKILMIDAENNLLLIKGAIPGWNGGYVFVTKS